MGSHVHIFYRKVKCCFHKAIESLCKKNLKYVNAFEMVLTFLIKLPNKEYKFNIIELKKKVNSIDKYCLYKVALNSKVH